MKITGRHIIGTAARILTALLLLMTVLSGWAGYIKPSTWAVPSMLCLIFPCLWCLSLIVALLWLLISKSKLTAAICGGVLLLTALPFLNVSPISFPHEPDADEIPLKLVTYNVAGCQDIDGVQPGYSRTLSYVLNSNADVVCFQEFYGAEYAKLFRSQITEEQIDSLNSMYPYRIASTPSEVCIYSKYPVKLKKADSRKELQYFNYQLYSMSFQGHDISILNLHLTSYELSKSQKALASDLKHDPGKVFDERNSRSLYRKLRDAFIARAQAAHYVAELIKSVPGPLIVCGDFNDVPNSYAWRQIMDTGLKDAYCTAGNGPMITFNANRFFFHIDQIMYRPDEGMRACEITRGHTPSSDHYPVSVTFAIKKNKQLINN
ncbi:MAG: endonuclease/exonuclease/phosphatase family protein [Prevotella sp.]|nr:endonuclease/exonuclease/phosphatase family protein [Prevotella sp.]MCM1074229.1 endonuclease/exonuclease/phosphatase family protein [Ruminococcus sp.]